MIRLGFEPKTHSLEDNVLIINDLQIHFSEFQAACFSLLSIGFFIRFTHWFTSTVNYVWFNLNLQKTIVNIAISFDKVLSLEKYPNIMNKQSQTDTLTQMS